MRLMQCLRTAPGTIYLFKQPFALVTLLHLIGVKTVETDQHVGYIVHSVHSVHRVHHLVYGGIWKFKFEVIIAKFPLSFQLQRTVTARWQLKVQHGWWLSADYVCKIKNAFVKCITLLNFNFNFNTKPWSHNNFAFAISVAVAGIVKLHFACWRCICLIYYKVHIRSSSFSQRQA